MPKPKITVHYDGSASIDANDLFQEESEQKALRRLGEIVRRQIVKGKRAYRPTEQGSSLLS